MIYASGTCACCGLERPLKYARRTHCSTYRCQQAAKAAVAERRGDAGGSGGVDGAGTVRDKAPTFCFKVFECFGQRYLDEKRMPTRARRNDVPHDAYTIAYLVQGKFGEDADDEGLTDIRWVDLEDLVDNQIDLSPIEEYENDLQRDMEWRRSQVGA